ncbi:MAG: hypothetical protein GF381_03740 [Candidatus Pacebacteria bacterium]|nr:hypothetical protein [Candidatus Paceibacterota bacterium]
MPKKIFWPATLVVMGFILLASNLGILPPTFWNLWPIILIVVGLGGLITADREEWLIEQQKSKKRKPTKKPANKSSKTKKKANKKSNSKPKKPKSKKK